MVGRVGMWLQPPHFRIAMEKELVDKCVKIGGPLKPKAKVFEDVNDVDPWHVCFVGRYSIDTV